MNALGGVHLARFRLVGGPMDEDVVKEALKANPIRMRPMAALPNMNEFEVYLLAICVLFGLTYLIRPASIDSVESSLPSWAIALWYASLGIGGLIGLIFGTWKVTVIPLVDESALRNRLRLYAAGWGYIGTAAVIFGLLLTTLPQPQIVSGLITIAWGAAGTTRALRVVKLLHGQRKRGGGRHRD